MNRQGAVHACAFVMLFALITCDLLFAQSQSAWIHRSRLQLGVEYDNNTKEARSNPIAAPSMRIMFHYTGRRSYSVGSHLQMSYQGGYQGYWNHPDENKLINDISGEVARSLTPGWCIGLQARARLKLFLNRNIDYYMGNGNVYSLLRLPARFSSRLTLTCESLDYAGERMFDFNGVNAHLSLDHLLNRWLSFSIFATYQRRSFDRMAFDYAPAYNIWSPGAPKQVDKTLCLGAQIECRRILLFYLTYVYENNNSNSYGFDYDRHRLQAVMGTNVTATLTLRIYAALQQKNYRDDLGPFFPLELDTEREESNFVVIDLSRDIGDLSLIVRTAFYDNESPIRELYYSKFTTSLSFELKF